VPNPTVPATLQALRDALTHSACTPPKPLISLGGNNAPILDYNLPQSTCFTSYGHLKVDVPSSATPITVQQIGLKTGIEKTGTEKIVMEGFGGFAPIGEIVDWDMFEPEAQSIPLFIIEEYETCSFIGDYGAGKALKTFSLLPGEKTTITVKTYKEITATQNRSESVLDSFSQESAADMEKLVEEESTTNQQDTNTTTSNAAVSLSLSGLKGKLLGGGVLGGTVGANRAKSKSTARTANVKSIDRALSKHVEKANSSRKIEVNTTSAESFKEGEEQTTVRVLENINKSRVLNFVFREMLQEYISITYLKNIRIAYSDGTPESILMVDIEDIDGLLETVFPGEDARRATVKGNILNPYKGTNLKNWQCTPIPLINESNQRRVSVHDTYTYTKNGQSKSLRVEGIILNISHYTLRTDSVICDAVMGQGEALDCFNVQLQDAAVLSAQLQNYTTLQALQVIDGITDPMEKAKLYKKVFGDCCDVAQTGCNCNNKGGEEV
jgi:hypothetical protein